MKGNSADHPSWIGDWLVLDDDADWIKCSGKFFDQQELWRKAGLDTGSGIRTIFPEIFPDKHCMDCLMRTGWKERMVTL